MPRKSFLAKPFPFGTNNRRLVMQTVLFFFLAQSTKQTLGERFSLPVLGPLASESGAYFVSTFQFQGDDSPYENVTADAQLLSWQRKKLFIANLSDAGELRYYCTSDHRYDLENKTRDTPRSRFDWNVRGPIAFAERRNWEGKTFADQLGLCSPLPRCLSNLEIVDNKYDRASSALILNGAVGRCIASNRSPAEARFFGYPVRCALVQHGHFYWQLYGNLCALSTPVSATPFFLNASKLNALSADIVVELDDDQNLPASQWHILTLLESKYAKALRNGLEKIEFHYELAAAGVPSLAGSLQLDREKVSTIENLLELTDLVCREQSMVYLDPFSRGIYLEQLFASGEENNGSIFDKLLTIAHSIDVNHPGERLTAFASIAAIGFAPTPNLSKLFSRSMFDGPDWMATSTVLAHWRWPLSELQVQRLADAFHAANDPRTKQALLEALLVAGYFDKIGKVFVEQWFDVALRVDSRRWRAIQLLAQSKEGRSLLVDRYLATPKNEAWRKSLVSGIELEIQASRAADQFIWIRKNEIIEIEKRLTASQNSHEAISPTR